MNKRKAIEFAGLMEDYLNIPSMICERIEHTLINGKYEEVIDFILRRRKELEQGSDSNGKDN